MSFWPQGLNLRQRLALLLLIASVPGMIVAIVLAIYALRDQGRQIETTARYLANLQAAQHSSVMQSARVLLDTLIASGDLRGPISPRCDGLTSDWMNRYPSFTSLMMIDAQGRIRCAVEPAAIPVDPAKRPWFDEVRRAKEFTVGTWTLSPAGTPLVIAGLPMLDAGGDFVGAVAVTIDLRWLEFLARRVDLPRGTTVTALAADGSVLSHHVIPAPKEGEPTAAFPAYELRQQMVALGQGTLRGPNQAGDPRTWGFHRTDAGGLVVAVGMSPYVAFSRYGAALRDTLMAPLAVLILALIAAWWGAEHLITRWVRALIRTARRMEEGDLAVRAAVPHSSYEIGALAAAFDGMAESIQERETELRAALQERETLLQELHHRVKNNMQMVISLINLHARHIESDALRARLDDVRKRIQALATVHDLLFQRERRMQSPSPDYAQRLCESLSQLYRSDDEGIAVELSIAPVRLSTDQAIPFGLILSELVSNAYKHGFPDGQQGRIRIVLEAEDGAAGEESGHLIVEDDGAGPVEGRDPLDDVSTGLQVASVLAGQLHGTLSFERARGRSRFHLRFPLAAAAPA